MKIAIVPGSWWKPACEALDVDHVDLPHGSGSPGELYSADLAARSQAGQLASEILAREPADFILDAGGTGLLFVEGPGGFSELKLLHEMREMPLVSHLADSIFPMTQGVPWEALWRSLGSRLWIKAVGDPAHAAELRKFAVPNVADLPPSAGGYQYDTGPFDKETIQADVSFVGDSSMALFSTAGGASGGVDSMAGAVDVSIATGSFFDRHYGSKAQTDPPEPGETPRELLGKATSYFNAKLKWSAACCRAYRDRFVGILAREFGSRLRLTGRGWESVPGCRTAPPASTMADYLQRFRTAAVNVCAWDGLCESTISAGHFETTAAGGFLLCQHHPQVAEHFEIGKECDTFADENELIEKVRYYVEHPDKRMEIAQAGRRRTLAHHLLRHRLEAVLAWRKQAHQRIAAGTAAASVPRSGERASVSGPVPDRIGVGKEDGKLLILLNPGKFTRHYLADMASAAGELGIPTVVYDLNQIVPILQARKPLDERPFIDMLRRERVSVALSCGPNGFSEWPCAARPDGGVVPFFERMNIPHIMWWTDHPQWNSEKMSLREDLQPLLRSPNIHHFVKSELAARELHDLLGWPNCYGLPVAENPEGLKPVSGIEPEFDVVAVTGSIPRPHPAVEHFLEDDAPDFEAMMRAVAEHEGRRLNDLFDERAPESLQPALEQFGQSWLQAKVGDVNTGSYWWFKRLEPDHVEAARYLREDYLTYFEAIDILWQLTNWQRTFLLRYLSKYFTVGVLGADWSSVGLGKTERIDHHDQPRAYARGRVALNVSQGNDEEGISHKPFQMAASGAAMVHVNRRGLSDCFTPGSEVAVFDTPAQARAVIAELLADPDRRRAMALAGRQRLCRDHTWTKRLPSLLRVVGMKPGVVSEATSEVKTAEGADAPFVLSDRPLEHNAPV